MTRVFSFFRQKPSLAVILLVCLTITEVHLNQARPKNKSVIAWDVVGYYSYLPATFIDKDLRLDFITPQNETYYYAVRYAFLPDGHGHKVFKYPMGMAILYAPFFLVAHAAAEPLGFSADGYSEIYQWCIEFSGLFYLLFGLICLRRFLLMHFTEGVTALSLFTIFFGTNLLCYATLDAAMSHAYSFSLFSALLYVTARYYKNPKWQLALAAAILSGLLVLVRPPNALLILAVVLFGLTNLADAKARVRMLWQQRRHVLLFGFTAALVVLPQFLYWHYVTGKYLVFSYGEEGFFFGKPHLLECLVGFRKGWLIYSPVCLLALAGLGISRRHNPGNLNLANLVILPAYLYIVASWWCWWYGGSFGQRPMIDVYPMLCVPLAAWLTWMFSRAKKTRLVFTSILAFLIALNIYQTFQYKYNIIHYDSMTAKAYLNAFGKMERRTIDTSLLQHPDYGKALRGFDN